MVSITTGGWRREQAGRTTRTLVRIALVAAVVAALAAVAWFGLPERLSLDRLRADQGALLAFVHAHPWESLALYVAAYVAVVSLSLPGALVMTLTGGFLFGALEGGAAAVTAVSLGCVLMFLLARTAVGEEVRAWLARRSALLRRLEGEVRAHPFTTTLTLRLIPAAPICVVNLAAGFVRMPLGPYALATVVGVIPSTFLYASVGSGLGRMFRTVRPGAVMTTIRAELMWPAIGILLLAALPLGVRWWSGRRVAGRRGVQ